MPVDAGLAPSLTGTHATLDGMSSVDRIKHLAERADIAAEELFEFLESPSGRRVRTVLAGAVIVSVPLIMRVPGLKRSPLGRLVAMTWGSAILIGYVLVPRTRVAHA